MNESCNQWERWVAGEMATEESDRSRHLEGCPVCREQWTAHLAFSELARIPAPRLSRDLSAELLRAVSPESEGELLSPAARRVMRVYWLLATFVAGLILAQTDASTAAWLLAGVGLAALLLAGTPALLLLRRRLSWGLTDLVLWTLH